MAISGPCVVAKAGRTAFNISTSGFALSSLIQKAHSSPNAATHVMPRTRRNDAGRTSSVMRVVSVSVSLVRASISCWSSGVDCKIPRERNAKRSKCNRPIYLHQAASNVATRRPNNPSRRRRSSRLAHRPRRSSDLVMNFI